MLTFLIIIAGASQLIVSLFVLLKKPKNISYVLFFALGITTLLWALTNYLTVLFVESESIIYIVRFILFFVVLQNSSFFLFAKTYPSSQWVLSFRTSILYFIFTSIVATFTLTPYVFSAAKVSDGIATTSTGPAIILFGMHAFYSITLAFISLTRKIKRSKGQFKRQLLVLFGAAMLNWTLVPITNFVITPLFKTTVFIEYAPIYTFMFSAVIAYAIVTQRLFDIRAVVARSVAYLLLILSLSLLYGLFIISISTLFLQDESVSLKVIASFAVTTLLIGYSLQPLKTFFDKASNRFFFRDAYNSQDVLNKLSEMLAKNIRLSTITKDSLKTISNAVRPLGSKLVVLSEDKQYTKEIYDDHIDTENILEDLNLLHEQVTVVSELDSSKIAKQLKKRDIEIVVRLQNQESIVGYLLFKAKKSGNIYSNQDMDLLSISANEIAIAIQNALHFDEIQKFNVTLQHKIDVATAQLQHNNEKLKALDEAKDEFISMASHQLRTPLTSIKGYVSMVMEGDAGKINKQQRELLTSAFNSSQRMVYLIADLLNVSRLHTGKFIIEPAEVNLADVIESEILQLKETASGHQTKLVYKKPKKFPAVLLDENKTRQVIMNFIDNAIYYTPKGGTVTITLKSNRKKIEFTVNDDGIGVPKSEQKNLFTKFYRAGNARKARPDGTGLGLFMAKKVVVAQGGAIIFHSKEGKGSTFGFTFPLDKIKVKKSSSPASK